MTLSPDTRVSDISQRRGSRSALLHQSFDALTRMETLLMSSFRSIAARRPVTACIAALAAVGVLGGAPLAASQDDACPTDHKKVERKLHENLHRVHTTTDRTRQRVIIRARPGTRAALKALGRGGRGVRADHALIDAFTVDLDAAGLARYMADPRVESISFDAEMHGDQTSTVNDPITVLAQRTSKTTTATTLNPGALRGMLGLTSSTYAGTGVTVALIDSGLE